MTAGRDEIRLVIPAEEDFRPIAHLVTGGLGLRLDLTYDDLEDVQVAIEALLGLRDDEDDVVVSLGLADGALRAAVGPFADDAVRELDEERGELGLRRVLETVSDGFDVERHPDGAWVELRKRLAPAAEASA
ncbi:MAG TPA: hypothetical protein VFJ77_01685 [Gaiellaceae bacterium]|nr:hypothetical protein [Gaiellaceae bacterium]